MVYWGPAIHDYINVLALKHDKQRFPRRLTDSEVVDSKEDIISRLIYLII